MKLKKMSFTTRYVIVVGLLLMAANLLLGMVIMRQSKAAMRTLIDKNMLDVANSAAAMLDGDVLGALTENDVGGEVFNEIARKLLVFLNNQDIHFIYTVKPSGEGRFTFIVDPDPVDPGAFGEEIIVTDTIPIDPKYLTSKIKVVSVAPLFARAIQNVFTNESVASLFDPDFAL